MTQVSRREFLQRTAVGASLLAASQAVSGGILPGSSGMIRRALADSNFDLMNPRLATPVFCQPGDTFNVEIEAHTRLDPRGWRVALRSPLGARWSCSVVDTTTEGINYNRDCQSSAVNAQ